MSETIINGIDVSECPLFDKKTGCYHTFNGKCVKDSCAVYKWLLEYKHLQEENEGLKSLNDFNVQKIEVFQEDNEKLKKIKDDFFKQAEISHQAVQDKNKIIEKLETVIQEIRNIAETPIIADKNRFDEITNKINEVLNDRN